MSASTFRTMCTGCFSARSAALVVAVVAVLITIYSRWSALAQSPLNEDELFLLRAVWRVAETGWPEFPGGGYYPRGLLYQYVSALLLHAGISDPVALRLPAAICGILVLIPVWRIASAIGGRPAAAFALVLCALSLWQVEFSRFGRMYAVFQLIFCWQLWWSATALNHSSPSASLGWLMASVPATALIHEGAVFSLLLLLLVFIARPANYSVRQWLLLAVIAIWVLTFSIIDWRHLGLHFPSLPEELKHLTYTPLLIRPPLIAPWLWQQAPIFTSVLFGALLLTLLNIGHRFRSVLFSQPLLYLGCISAIAASSLNLCALAAVGLTSAWLLDRPQQLDARTMLKWSASLCGIIGVGMFGLSLYQTIHSSSAMALSPLLKDSASRLIDYPDIWSTTLDPLTRAMPVWVTTIAALILLALTGLGQRRAQTILLRSCLGLLGMTLLLLGMIATTFVSSRYSFFLYAPLLAIVAGASCLTWRYRPTGPYLVVAVLCLLPWSEDLNWRHLISPASPEHAFRLNYHPAYVEHLYPRHPYQAIAIEIDKIRSAYKRPLIVWSGIPGLELYTPISGEYRALSNPDFPILSANRGQMDHYSGLPLIYSVATPTLSQWSAPHLLVRKCLPSQETLARVAPAVEPAVYCFVEMDINRTISQQWTTAELLAREHQTSATPAATD